MTEKIKIQKVLVVEGKGDTVNLRRFYDVDAYETRGSAINDDGLERIERLNDLRGVIVFTDPDCNGERIRKIVMNVIPNVKRTFLDRDKAASKSESRGCSLGVKHANFEDSQKTPSGVLGNFDDDNQFGITRANPMRMGLLMGNDSRKHCECLGKKFRIGYSNGKQFLKCLELFGITLAEVEEAMGRYGE